MSALRCRLINRDQFITGGREAGFVSGDVQHISPRSDIHADEIAPMSPDHDLGVALKATPAASWRPERNLPVRDDRAAFLSLCLDHDFRLGFHEPNTALDVVSHAFRPRHRVDAGLPIAP